MGLKSYLFGASIFAQKEFWKDIKPSFELLIHRYVHSLGYVLMCKRIGMHIFAGFAKSRELPIFVIPEEVGTH